MNPEYFFCLDGAIRTNLSNPKKITAKIMLNIALIESHPITRYGITTFLRENIEDTSIAHSADWEEYQLFYSAYIPEIFILGINRFCNPDDVQTIYKIKAYYPVSKIIIFDVDTQDTIIQTYFKAGISGYLVKYDDLTRLIDCIGIVKRGKKYLDSQELVRLLAISPSKLVKKRSNTKLSNRENEIASYLTEGRNTNWIAQAIGRKPSTVSTIKRNIFTKLAVGNVIDLKKRLQPKHAERIN
jgi:DNA-binding NarL/FixJ family response regulator